MIHILRAVRSVGVLSLCDPVRLPRLLALVDELEEQPLAVRALSVQLEKRGAVAAAWKCAAFMQRALHDVRAVHLSGFAAEPMLAALDNMADLQTASLAFWNEPPAYEFRACTNVLKSLTLHRYWRELPPSLRGAPHCVGLCPCPCPVQSLGHGVTTTAGMSDCC